MMKRDSAVGLSASYAMWDTSFQRIDLCYSYKERMHFCGMQCGRNSMLQVKCPDHIISEEVKKHGGQRETAERRHTLNSLREVSSFCTAEILLSGLRDIFRGLCHYDA